MGTLFDKESISWYWVWEDILKEKKCEQIKDLEKAKQKQSPDQILIPCPNGDNVYILIPKEYAEIVLKNGKMI